MTCSYLPRSLFILVWYTDFVQATSREEFPGDFKLFETATWLETDSFEHQPSLSDVSLNKRTQPSSSVLTTKANFALSAQLTDSFGSFIFSMTRPRTAPSFDHRLSAMLPDRNRGLALLQYYFDEINWLYYVIHIPTVRRQFDDLYTCLETNQLPNYGHLALISTLYAICAYYSSSSAEIFFKHTEALSCCHRWTLLAQEALSAANCLSNPTLVTLQSLVLITSHLVPNCGALASLRTLIATSTHVARALSLHQTDSASNKLQRKNMEVDWAEVEVKRRIWWHIASTDWYVVCSD
jgi:hypothetical protein